MERQERLRDAELEERLEQRLRRRRMRTERNADARPGEGLAIPRRDERAIRAADAGHGSDRRREAREVIAGIGESHARALEPSGMRVRLVGETIPDDLL